MKLPFYFLLLLTSFTACQPQQKQEQQVQQQHIQQAIIQKKIFFEELPSASGVELVDSLFYILSDDSPFLYVLNPQYQLIDTIRLFETKHFINGRIPTEVKYDPEALAQLQQNGQRTLIAVGSGAKELRERVFLIDLPKSAQKRPQVTQTLFKNLYAGLKNDAQVGGQEQLNLEGLAVDAQFVYLLPRTLKTTGTVLVYRLQEWQNFLADSAATPVYQKLQQVKLPELHGVKAGMSGATVFDGYLFFTASVENTQSATLDGEVLGSFVGRVALEAVHQNQKAVVKPAALQIINSDGSPYTGKAESLTVLEKTAENQYRAVVVSDDDQGHSEVLEVELRF